MKTITFYSIKGGIGKSTISIIIAGMLSKTGNRVLIIDADFQNSTSFTFLPDEKHEESIYNVMIQPTEDVMRENIIKVSDNLSIIPSSLDLLMLSMESSNTDALKTGLDFVKDDYDFVLIDCHPTIDTPGLNSLKAADKIITPFELTLFDFKSCQFLRKYLPTVLGNTDAWEIMHNRYKSPRSNNMHTHTNKLSRFFHTEFEDKIIDVRIPHSALLKSYVEQGESITKSKNKVAVFTAFSNLFELLTGKKYKEITI